MSNLKVPDSHAIHFSPDTVLKRKRSYSHRKPTPFIHPSSFTKDASDLTLPIISDHKKQVPCVEIIPSLETFSSSNPCPSLPKN